jgi:predicted amidohydrolase
MLTVVPGDGSGHDGGKDGLPSLIDEIVREGARRMLAGALQAEVDAYIARFADERDENGRRLVVRNGCHQPREVLTSAGAIEVTVPRVNDKRTDPATGERMRFSSAIVPPWARKTPKITEVLPLLYLHGLSSGDFRARARPVPGLVRRAVGGRDHEADRDLEGRAACLRGP